MLDEIRALAGALDTSPAWIIEQSWSLARSEVQKLEGNRPWRAERIFAKNFADSDKVKQVLKLPVDTMTEIKNQAARLDRSMSWLVSRCFCVARESLDQSKSAMTGA